MIQLILNVIERELYLQSSEQPVQCYSCCWTLCLKIWSLSVFIRGREINLICKLNKFKIILVTRYLWLYYCIVYTTVYKYMKNIWYAPPPLVWKCHPSSWWSQDEGVLAPPWGKKCEVPWMVYRFLRNFWRQL